MSKAYFKWLDIINDSNHVWTEREIISFLKAIGPSGIKDAGLRKNLRAEFMFAVNHNNGFRITLEQDIKGQQYLLNNSLKKNGTTRKQNVFATKQLEQIKKMKYHLFSGLYVPKNHSEYVLPIYTLVDKYNQGFSYVGATYSQIVVLG